MLMSMKKLLLKTMCSKMWKMRSKMSMYMTSIKWKMLSTMFLQMAKCSSAMLFVEEGVVEPSLGDVVADADVGDRVPEGSKVLDVQDVKGDL